MQMVRQRDNTLSEQTQPLLTTAQLWLLIAELRKENRELHVFKNKYHKLLHKDEIS